MAENTDQSTVKYSAESVAASSSRPGRQLRSSEVIGWRSLLLQTFEQPQNVSDYHTLASPDALLVFVLEGSYEIESFSSGAWKRATYRPGVGGFTAPFTTNRLRWFSKVSGKARILRMYVPQYFLEEAHEALRSPGERSTPQLSDTLSLSGSVFYPVVKSSLTAMECGEPDLYAEVCARFLAANLIFRLEKRSDRLIGKLSKIEIPDRRLNRVLEFMQHNFASDLSIEELAREAGISPFHFSRIFKQKVGVSPHHHLRQIRLAHSRVLLEETDLAVSEVAEACGYLHTGHFAAAFQQMSGCSPRNFRAQRRRGVVETSADA